MKRLMLAGLALAMLPALPAQAQRAGQVRSEEKTVALPGGGTLTYTLGFLSVPENRHVPGSRLIEVAFLRLPALPGASGPPLVYLAGGPGNAGISQDPRALAGWASARAVGDVVLLDQRGTGLSQPNLGYRWEGELPLHQFVSADSARAFARTVSQAAADFFRGRGVDLRGYTTEESADDVDALRAALGAEQLNLFGFSYGTHLALSIIRRHGPHVKNAVLAGVEGPAHTEKLPLFMDVQWVKLALMAGADSEIARTVPDLTALLRRVLDRLDREPMPVTIRHPRTGQPLTLGVGGDGLRFLLRADIGDASDLPVFPRLLYSIDRGDPTLLRWFVQKRFGTGFHAMSAVMDAASGVSPGRLALIREQERESMFGRVVNFPFPDGAYGMDAPDLGPAFRSPVISPVRVLFLSGTLDWNAPPFQAEEVRFGFPNASHIIVRNAGHEQITSHPAIVPAMTRFLKGDTVDDVTAGYPPLRFVPLEGYDPARTHPSVPRP